MYKIVTLDGGGIRGLLSLLLMKRLEAEMPDWLKEVDFFAGTSVGGIIAICSRH
jgi:patatin-like phospholipase/acyl hydrolase